MTQPAAPPAADRPAHFRLGDETWALILKEYREGATAPFLSRKWRVSEPAIRRRATQHKSTKRDWGDAQAITQALAREAELEEARRNSPEAVAARLFDGVALDEAQAGDAAALMRVAVLASGRAMKGRLWSEAKALAGLAESYARLAEKGGRSGGSIETIDLELLYEIVLDPDQKVSTRFAVDPDNPDAPGAALKRAYWAWRGETYGRIREREYAHMDRLRAAERRLADRGLEAPEPTPAMVAAEEHSRMWAELTDEEIDEMTDGRAEG